MQFKNRKCWLAIQCVKLSGKMFLRCMHPKTWKRGCRRFFFLIARYLICIPADSRLYPGNEGYLSKCSTWCSYLLFFFSSFHVQISRLYGASDYAYFVYVGASILSFAGRLLKPYNKAGSKVISTEYPEGGLVLGSLWFPTNRIGQTDPASQEPVKEGMHF